MGTLVVVAIQLASIEVGIFYAGLIESERNFFVSISRRWRWPPSTPSSRLRHSSAG